MKRFFFFLAFPLLIYAQVSDKIKESILYETRELEKLESILHSSDDQVLELYNERAISYFAQQKYTLALADFNHILEEKIQTKDLQTIIIGEALWGRSLCHACLDMNNELAEDLTLLSQFLRFFEEDCLCNDKKTILSSAGKNFIILPVVRFADPDENISAYECRERVRGSAEKVRLFLGPLLKDTVKRTLFLTFITGLENQGIACCRDGSIWATCVSPILNKLEKWHILGIPADPAWD